MPDPGTNPAGPYSISHGPPVLGLVHDKAAEVASGIEVKFIGAKHC